MLFRFLSKSSGRFAYVGPMINAVSALIRSRYGMARDGRALKIGQKLSETVLSSCKLNLLRDSNTENKAQMKRPEPVRPAPAGRTGSGRVLCFVLIGGCVKGATPLVFICPLHINIKNN